jgi:hypothetical protein
MEGTKDTHCNSLEDRRHALEGTNIRGTRIMIVPLLCGYFFKPAVVVNGDNGDFAVVEPQANSELEAVRRFLPHLYPADRPMIFPLDNPLDRGLPALAADPDVVGRIRVPAAKIDLRRAGSMRTAHRSWLISGRPCLGRDCHRRYRNSNGDHMAP